MKTKGIIIVVVVLALVLVGLIIKSKFFGRQGPGALQISTTPTATVFLDGSQVGITPYFDDKIKSGEHTVKLVPESTEGNLTSWEGKVNLLSGILTSIKRTFAVNEAESSAEMITLEKAGRKDASSLTVISIPDQAVVKLNGEPKGFTPLSLEDLAPADYQITISSSGYEEKTVAAHTIGGYKLIVNVKLAQTMEGIEEATPSSETEEETEADTEATASPSPKNEATPPPKPYVKVKDTPTGFLRVRLGPSTASTEAAQIKPGEMYAYLNEEESGWLKIEYKKDEEGWVSGVYVDLIK
ncbi:PEGA domain-containing protein [Patescibacteria group bacterium]|nr:PEGA domain-containing protein [Patescibacteria group bacterium]